MRAKRDRIILLTFTTLAAACSGNGSSDRGYAIGRDSAGITIVENEAVSTPLWQFGDEPVLTLGEGTGPETEFYRVAGAVVLGDGRLVVADGGSGELRFFDRTGSFVGSVGGMGGGPGEFDQLEFVARLAGDTVVTFDGGRRQVSWFDPEGELAYSVSLSEVVRTSTDVAGVLGDGSIVVVDHGSMYSRSPAESEAGQTVRDTATVLRVSPAAERVDTITLLECGRGSVERLVAMGMSQLFMAPMHFTATPLVSARGDQVMVGDCSEYSLRLFGGADGVFERIVHKEHTRVTPGEDDIANVLQAYRNMVGDGPNPFAQLTLDVLTGVPAAEFFPPYGGLPARVTIDSEGNLWIPFYTPVPSIFVFGDMPPVVTSGWDVFDTDGRLLGVVEAPPGFRLTDLGDGIAVGVETDVDGVEQVVVYELTR